MKEKVTNKRIDRGEKGQSLVELALTLLIILTLLAGAVDFGMAFFSYVAVRDAAQEGALFGSIKPIIDSNNNGRYEPGEPLNTGEIETRLRQSSSTPVDLNDWANVTVNVTPSGCYSNPPHPPCAGGWIRVSVSYNYQLSIPFLGTILGTTTIPLNASVTDTILQPACPLTPACP
jgi:hypothetical protein